MDHRRIFLGSMEITSSERTTTIWAFRRLKEEILRMSVHCKVSHLQSEHHRREHSVGLPRETSLMQATEEVLYSTVPTASQ